MNRKRYGRAMVINFFVAFIYYFDTMETMILQLLTRKQYAIANDITEMGVDKAVKAGNLTKVEFVWFGKGGEEYKGKFILPREYAIVNREELLKVAKGFTS